MYTNILQFYFTKLYLCFIFFVVTKFQKIESINKSID